MSDDFDKVLRAYEPDLDACELNRLRATRSDPGTAFDETMVGLEKRLAFLRARVHDLTEALETLDAAARHMLRGHGYEKVEAAMPIVRAALGGPRERSG